MGNVCGQGDAPKAVEQMRHSGDAQDEEHGAMGQSPRMTSPRVTSPILREPAAANRLEVRTERDIAGDTWSQEEAFAMSPKHKFRDLSAETTFSVPEQPKSPVTIPQSEQGITIRVVASTGEAITTLKQLDPTTTVGSIRRQLLREQDPDGQLEVQLRVRGDMVVHDLIPLSDLGADDVTLVAFFNQLPSISLVFRTHRSRQMVECVLSQRPLGFEFWQQAPLVIKDVQKGCYGERAGIQIGYELVAINGIDVSHLGFDDCRELLGEASKVLKYTSSTR